MSDRSSAVMKLANIHCHILYGVDDGAKDGKIMRKMIDLQYADGVRLICLTPHYNPAYFRPNPSAVKKSYQEAVQYAAEKYPDLKILLGQEIYCHHDPVNELLLGKCLSLNRTRNVLLEFGYGESAKSIISKVSRLLTSGFVPLIAHVERYSSLRGDRKAMEELCDLGAKFQVNAAAVVGKRGFMTKRFVFSLIKAGLVDVIADDCHDLVERPPCMREAFETVRVKFGDDVAKRLFWDGPIELMK